MTKKERVRGVLAQLDTYYTENTICYLNYGKSHELLIATILSAQCTDDRVNMVTPALFSRYPDIEAFASADLAELEGYVKQTGFYRNKAKHIIAAMQKLLVEFGGEMPSDIESLTGLDGVGRKTANVVRTHIFGIPSVVVDTHVKRVSNKLGLTKETDPVKIEFELMKVLPKSHWSRFNTQIIAHGRKICAARSPKCGECCLSEYCAAFSNTQ